ncbi:MAG: alpha/beta fold hydrolase [Verrucomicrobia bacterium]|nr:alpha/beta fold hydrolase [Verrucomicrobiota bacterium]
MKPLRALPCMLAMLASDVAAQAPDTVVLLHGLGRTSASMARIARALRHEGYDVVNVSYPSRHQPIETLATEWLPAQLRAAAQAPAPAVAIARPPDPTRTAAPAAAVPRVHFVTHSMGGIVVRLWLRECGAPANLGRVVMLAPPNAGSELSDRLRSNVFFRWFMGRNGRRLGTGADSLPRTLGPWPATSSDLGIIAGDRPLTPLMASWLPAPSDGKVTVAATHLAGERDHVVLHYSHTWIGWRRETIAQMIAFLRDGRFAR